MSHKLGGVCTGAFKIGNTSPYWLNAKLTQAPTFPKLKFYKHYRTENQYCSFSLSYSQAQLFLYFLSSTSTNYVWNISCCWSKLQVALFCWCFSFIHWDSFWKIMIKRIEKQWFIISDLKYTFYCLLRLSNIYPVL